VKRLPTPNVKQWKTTLNEITNKAKNKNYNRILNICNKYCVYKSQVSTDSYYTLVNTQ